MDDRTTDGGVTEALRAIPKTAVDRTAAGGKETTAQRRAKARNAYRTSLAEGVPLTGAELGRRFGLSPRWGRLRVAEVHAEAPAAGNGRHPAMRGVAESDTLDAERARRPSGRHGQPPARRLAETASVRTNGSAPPSIPRTASERPPDDRRPGQVTRTVQSVTTLAVLAVAFVAAIASYDHQRALAELAGEGWRAWLLPVSVDGLVVAASMSMLVQRRAGCLPGCSPGHHCSLGSVRASLPTLLSPTPRRSAASWPPGRQLPCSSRGSC